MMKQNEALGDLAWILLMIILPVTITVTDFERSSEGQQVAQSWKENSESGKSRGGDQPEVMIVHLTDTGELIFEDRNVTEEELEKLANERQAAAVQLVIDDEIYPHLKKYIRGLSAKGLNPQI